MIGKVRWSKKSGQKSCLTLKSYEPEEPGQKAS
jgi:hypothetical protein